ncbi:MAG: LamG domain-containing protein [Verrucomicrobia bacterium]|nr:LamG domain-containing protein [Verrucomicrobiota bacterium]
MMQTTKRFLISCVSTVLAFQCVMAADPAGLREALTFHASFDDGIDADIARGDKRGYTGLCPEDMKPGLLNAKIVIAKNAGKFGGALKFTKKTMQLVSYLAKNNIDYKANNWNGTFSIWMSVDPEKDLHPDDCIDPLRILAQKSVCNATFFLDFLPGKPVRPFRLGAFPDVKLWNPNSRDWGKIPENEQPLVVVKKHPFGRGRWNHVVITFSGFNGGDKPIARLYLDGKLQGAITKYKQIFTWDTTKSVITLGVNYVGLIDDLAVFNRELTETEVQELFKLPNGIKSLSAK